MKDFFFAREQHVCQQIGKRKLNKKNKNLKFNMSLSQNQFLRKITPIDKLMP